VRKFPKILKRLSHEIIFVRTQGGHISACPEEISEAAGVALLPVLHKWMILKGFKPARTSFLGVTISP
jgi:hypothetical protein